MDKIFVHHLNDLDFLWLSGPEYVEIAVGENPELSRFPIGRVVRIRPMNEKVVTAKVVLKPLKAFHSCLFGNGLEACHDGTEIVHHDANHLYILSE